LLLFLGVSIFLCTLSERLRRTAQAAESHAAAAEAAREQLNRETGLRVASHQQELETRRWANDTLSSIGDGVICTDVDGNVTFMNNVAEQLTGWSNKEASGQPMMKVFRIINETTREPAVNPSEES
jgi:PAS domain-containing protein